MADKPEKSDRIAIFRCKGCGEYNEKPFPEVRVVTQKEPCKCGVDPDTRVHKSWALASCIAVSIFILAVFGSCGVDHYFTTEQIKNLPADYKVQHKRQGDALGPEYSIQKMTPEELKEKVMSDRIKELEGKLKAEETDPIILPENPKE